MELTIREMREDDRPEIYKLYGESFGAESLAAFKKRWQWEFVDNPRISERPSTIWVAEMKDGRLVGHMASFTMLLKAGERLVATSSSGDLLVSPHARGQGLGERLSQTYRDSNDVLATDGFGYQPVTGRIYRRLGYQEVECMPFYLRPMDLRALYRFMLVTGRLPKFMHLPVVRSFGMFAAVLANLGLAVVNRLRTPRGDARLHIKVMNEPAADIEDLWRRVSPDLPCAMVRDQAFLKWRFWNDPNAEHKVLEARDGSGTLQGYLVYSVSNIRGLDNARLMDLLCPPKQTGVIDSLVAAMLADLRARNVGVIMCWGMHPDIRDRLRKFLYVLPRGEQAPTLLYCLDESLKPLVYDGANWHATRSDGDEGFVP